MTPLAIALGLGGGLIALGLATGWTQATGLRALRGRTHVPSDEFAYLRNRHRRRLLTACVLVVTGSLVAGAYLTGLEAGAEALAAPPDGPPAARPVDADGVPVLTPEQKEFLRFWWSYWIVVIVLVFVLVGLAMVDAISTRRYWLGIYRELRAEHQSKLRRDLAVYRRHKEQNRAGPGRLGPPPAPSGDAGH